MAYIRRGAQKAIVRALQSVGGTASRDDIKSIIAEDDGSGFTHDDVYGTVISRKGNEYIPFNYDFNFAMRELSVIDYIEKSSRGGKVTLTEQGRADSLSDFPNKAQKQAIREYWDHTKALREAKSGSNNANDQNSLGGNDDESTDDAQDVTDTWKTELLASLKKFSPTKFERFSRLLISQMGVKIDAKMGMVVSGDHGIDGFGYFQSDEFRTSRVAIQSKRYSDAPVGEPEIDKFKGVMDGFNAEYGIFITTSYYTDGAKKKAVQGAKSVTLIDGPGIVKLVERYQLHISPVQTFELDDYYFEQD